MRRLLAAALLSLLAPAAAIADTPSRLPPEVVPLNYDLRIVPDVGLMRFDGEVTIEVEVRAPVTEVVLNAARLNIDKAEIDGAAAASATDDTSQRLTLTPRMPLNQGIHKIHIVYRGQIGQGSSGLFAAPYQARDGSRKFILATQFEAADARRMLPCFDEPEAKAVFTVTADLPAGEVGLSNMPLDHTETVGNRIRHIFEPTPKMSSYLLFLGAGDLEKVEENDSGTRIAVWTLRGDTARARYALDVAGDQLRWMGSYFGIPYMLPKLDLIATPTARGAMENWGAIRSADNYLLYDSMRDSPKRRQLVYSVVTHEIVHQWFGDLVTMRWWDELWLNEGFASWLTTVATDQLHPDWGITLQGRRDTERVMHKDALRQTHPIVQRIDNVGQMNAAFDDITYRKGEAFLRMLADHVGADAFQGGLQQYLRTHAYGNATGNDLWAALETASGKKVRAVADSFTRQPGLPLVEVSARCAGGSNEVTLRQRRFSTAEQKLEEQRWSIPVRLAPLDGSAATSVLLEAPQQTVRLPGCAKLQVNPTGTGYFRTAYAPDLQQALTSAFAGLGTAEKLILLNDRWALAEAGQGRFEDWLTIAAQVTDERDLALLQHVLAVVSDLHRLADRKTRPLVDAWGRRLLAPAMARIGWEPRQGEPDADALLREELLTGLGEIGDPAVLAEARRRFALLNSDTQIRTDPTYGAGPMRGPLLEIVARHADAPTFEALLKMLRATPALLDKQLLLDALSAVEDPVLSARLLELLRTDDVPRALRTRVLGRVAQVAHNVDLAWRFAESNGALLNDGLDTGRRWRWTQDVMIHFDDREHLPALKRFVDANIAADNRRPFDQALEIIAFQAAKRPRLLPVLTRWISAHPLRG